MFKKKLLILSIVSLIMLVSLVTASVIYTDKLNAYNHFFLTEVEPRSNSLNAMLTSFGYGHAIHNFKNLLIRGEDEVNREKYINRLRFNKRQFYFAMYNYVALVNQDTLANHEFSQSAQQLISTERLSLKKIKIVFDRYIKESKQVEALYNQASKAPQKLAKHAIDQIDKKIRIDDEPALTGMKMLQAGISQLRAEVLNHSNQLVATLNILIIMASLVLAVFMCTAITFGFQLLRPIIRLSKAIEDTKSTRAAMEQIHYPHQDEIGRLFHYLKISADNEKAQVVEEQEVVKSEEIEGEEAT